MTQIAHTRDTASPAGELSPKYLNTAIELVMPEEASLMVLLLKLRSKKITAPKHYWYDKALAHRWDAINYASGYSSSDTTLTVDNAAYFRANDIIMFPRIKETALVTAVGSTSITVTRSWGDAAAASLVDNDPIVIIGNVNEEGSVSRPVKSEQESEYYNLLQILRTPFGTTRTEMQSTNPSGSDFAREQKDSLITHRLDMERTLLFSERAVDTSGTHPKRSMGGLYYWLNKQCNNIRDFGSLVTEDEFEDWMEDCFKYGSKEKALICSPTWLTEINRWGRHKLQTNGSDKTYGTNITTYISAHGKLNIVPSYALEGATFGYYSLLVDFKYLTLVYLEKIKHNSNIQLPDADERKDEYLSEFGLEISNWDAHGMGYFNQ